jgi:hypothetical protein
MGAFLIIVHIVHYKVILSADREEKKRREETFPLIDTMEMAQRSHDLITTYLSTL